jgi:hypothetical protein
MTINREAKSPDMPWEKEYGYAPGSESRRYHISIWTSES